ncbi:MAG TPA: M28 family peptidase, partial [Candidatus Acidoferrales bacterium]|nr:M28 family peptidase [Candidatus Acidoferrales bacterium]
MRRLAVFTVLFAVFFLLPISADQESLQGFTQQSAGAERQWENDFRAIPSPQNERDYMQHLSAHPHNVGTAYDKQNAEWILAHYKQWGWDAHIETFDVLFPTPKERLVELVAPTQFTAKLQEPAVPEDPTSNQTSEQLPTYNAYSADGDVTAPLVYANYGLTGDYDELQRLGVSVKGAIVIVRYGGSWRGVKPKLAAEHGAVGCLIYSDPHDDGYFVKDVFPKGPMRPLEGVQRGSVMDFATTQSGDPLTPGYGATADAKRLPIKDNPSLTKIPVLPISYGDAQPLLAALTGPMAPEAWRGSLAISYHVGPGAAKVHLRVMSNWDIKPVYDVIAKIPGAEYPDEWIVRGNHHDGWVNGAEDPISGQVAELEEARALSDLLKKGWKPKRTIIYCAWDGEEPGLLGSTEWGEEHDTELKQHAVAYINTDGNGRGFFGASGSSTLEHFVNGVARDITDPETNLSVRQRLYLREIADAKSG